MKSIFFKYLATFFLILVILFAVLTATITGIVESYGSNMTTTSLSNASNSAALYIKIDYSSEQYKSFDAYLQRETKDLRLLLELLCVNESHMLMFISNSAGDVIHIGHVGKAAGHRLRAVITLVMQGNGFFFPFHLFVPFCASGPAGRGGCFSFPILPQTSPVVQPRQPMARL